MTQYPGVGFEKISDWSEILNLNLIKPSLLKFRNIIQTIRTGGDGLKYDRY